jgi:hypothetical protein
MAGLRQLEDLPGGVGLEEEAQPQFPVGQDRRGRKAILESLSLFSSKKNI